MTERVTFVDENDQPFGIGTREEAWDKGFYVRLVRVTIRDENGRILSQHRVSTAKSYPNLWTNSASGHVDEGETYDIAAVRELNEELGISTDLKFTGEFILSEDRDDKKIRQLNHCYEGTVDSSIEFKLQEDEVSEIKWYELEELKSLMQQTPEVFTPGFRETINRFY